MLPDWFASRRESPHDGERLGGVALVTAADGAFPIHDAAVFVYSSGPPQMREAIVRAVTAGVGSRIHGRVQGEGFRHAAIGPPMPVGADGLGMVHHFVQHAVFRARRSFAGQRQEQAHGNLRC